MPRPPRPTARWLAAAALFGVTACVVPPRYANAAPEPRPDDVVAIESVARRYSVAFERGDAGRFLGLLTDDCVALPADRPALRGLDAIGAAFRRELAEVAVATLELRTEEVVPVEDWAYARGTSRSKVVPVGGAPVEFTGVFLWILRRQPDGSWKIARDMSHRDMPR